MTSNYNDWRRSNSSAYKNTIHFVFIAKYRRDVFTNEILLLIKRSMTDTCENLKSELLEFNGEKDHVHLLASVHPSCSIATIAGQLKGRSSYMTRRFHAAHLNNFLWGGGLWSSSYCSVSTGVRLSM